MEIFYKVELTTWGVIWLLLRAGAVAFVGLTLANVLLGMERPKLIGKYLRRKLAPLFAAVAVTLCTAMVIIVMSVMGGFLNNMREATKSLSPDITVGSAWTGFPHYEQLVTRLRDLEEVEAATPVIQTAGIIKFDASLIFPIPEILGVYPEELDGVSQYRDKLYWRDPVYPRNDPNAEIRPLDVGMSMQLPDAFKDPNNEKMQAIVPGIEVSPYAIRDDKGQYSLDTSSIGRRVTLTVVPVTQSGGLREPAVGEFAIVNEFKSGLYEIDDNRVYVPFEQLQRMLRMDAAAEVDPETGEETGKVIPGQASAILVKGNDTVELQALATEVRAVVAEFQRDHPEVEYMTVQTWEEKHARLLNAVGNEKGLITFLFAFISMVAVVMIASTFYMIVLEKTRDIGVLRAIGVSRFGIATLFQGYGLIIGLIGTALGVSLAYAIVYNLNEIQEVLDAWFGWRMWNPEIYYFDQIPEQVDPIEAILIACGAMVSCLLGATIPAFIAARLNPVEALRHE